MGLDIFSRVVLGFRVPFEEQVGEIRTRGCSHELADEEQKFCSHCGKPAWKVQSFNMLIEPEVINESYIFQANHDEDAFYVGHITKSGFSCEQLALFNFDDVKREFGELLTEEGIDVTKCEFGMYLAIYDSY